MRCSLSIFYIKPQPTCPVGMLLSSLFLISILHQTATELLKITASPGCSLSVFYIKPQLLLLRSQFREVVPYQYSTSNRNLLPRPGFRLQVVPYQYSTSNRNRCTVFLLDVAVVPYQYSTSNRNLKWNPSGLLALFLISILHQTATKCLSAIDGQ